MRIKRPSLTLLLLALFAFASLANAEEKVIEKKIELDGDDAKEIIIKIITDDDNSKDLDWITENGNNYIINVDEDGEQVVRNRNAFLGVILSDIDKEEAKDAGLRKNTGVRVTRVLEGAAAEKAGIEAGDIITRFDARKIDDSAELSEAVGESEVGQKVKIQLMRDRKKKTFTCVLGERGQDHAFLSPETVHSPGRLNHFDIRSPKGKDGIFLNRMFGNFSQGPRLGVEIRDLDKNMAGYFPGSKAGQVLVMHITKNSVAEEAGLLPGDIITAFDGNQVSDSDALREAVQEAEPRKEIDLRFIRKGEPMKVSFRFEEQDPNHSDSSIPGFQEVRRIHDFKKQNLEKRLEELEQKFEALSKKLDG